MPGGGDLLSRVRDSRIARVLRAARGAGSARAESVYLAGGAARDLLGGARMADVDLVVEGSPAGLARDLARRIGGRVVARSLFETCLVEGPGGVRVDVAMSRREIYRSPAALPVIYPAPILEDLLRRDFTINSMAIALSGPREGSLLDPSGGERDLRAGLLRIHHTRSLADDPTRAFRGARYASRLRLRAAAGWRAALAAADQAGSFTKLSSSRLRREIELIGSDADPAGALRLCARWGLLGKLDARLRATAPLVGALGRARAAATGGGESERGALFVSLLAWSLPPGRRRAFCARLGLEGEAARRIAAAAAAASRAGVLFSSPAGAKARVDRAREISEWTSLDVRAASAACGARVARSLRRERARWEGARPKLKGHRVADLGVPRGPRIAALLRALREARYLGRARTAREELDLARKWIAADELP